jgi:ADP-ribose pyrophosphatase YjhB (NUDIX family)
MVFAKDTKRWVIVRDNHTSEYILLLKGYYRTTFIKLFLSRLTLEELKNIKEILSSTIDVFIDIYLNKLDLEKNGLLYAIVRMAESRKDILKLIDGVDVSNNTLPWSWPKGRIQSYFFKETDYQCAIREFKEEVEIDLPPPLLISDNYIEEDNVKLTGRRLESRFWIYVIPNEIELNKPINHPEVSDRMWADTETCFKLIPKAINHTNLFKKVINSSL